MIVAYALLGVGVVLLVLAVLRVLPALRRLTRARAALQADVARGTSTLRELVNLRRRGAEGVTNPHERSWGSVGPAA